jgi:hypothetical protein
MNEGQSNMCVCVCVCVEGGGRLYCVQLQAQQVNSIIVRHITCCYEVLARQHYNVFGKLFAEPKDISTASVRDLCLYIKGTGLLNLC